MQMHEFFLSHADTIWLVRFDDNTVIHESPSDPNDKDLTFMPSDYGHSHQLQQPQQQQQSQQQQQQQQQLPKRSASHAQSRKPDLARTSKVCFISFVPFLFTSMIFLFIQSAPVAYQGIPQKAVVRTSIANLDLYFQHDECSRPSSLTSNEDDGVFDQVSMVSLCATFAFLSFTYFAKGE